MFSVVILTLNEERNLPICLASLTGCDDVVVLDSGSRDRTAEIAGAAGARVVVHPFENFADQRNFADRSVGFKHPWVFHLDADERMTPELMIECAQVARNNPSDTDGFFVAPRMLFRGRWIPHCTDFPAYQARFVHAERFRFVQIGHGQREAPDMRMKRLAATYLHDLSADGEEALLSKHRKYAREEAAAHLAPQPTACATAARAAHLARPRLISKDPLQRRRALKALSQRLPARGLMRFIYQYLLRRGFLDGTPGFAYCVLLAKYEHWIAQEIRRQKRGAA